MSKTTTKMAIAFAFKELLSEKALDKVTVQEIAKDLLLSFSRYTGTV